MRKIIGIFIATILFSCNTSTNNNSKVTKPTITNSTLIELIELTKMDVKDSLDIVKNLSRLGYALGDCIPNYSYIFITTKYGDLEKLKSLRGGATFDLLGEKISSIKLESIFTTSSGLYNVAYYTAPSYEIDKIVNDILTNNKEDYVLDRKTEINSRINKVVETITFLPVNSKDLPLLSLNNSEGYSMLSVSEPESS
jgi:hypothetical protein